MARVRLRVEERTWEAFRLTALEGLSGAGRPSAWRWRSPPSSRPRARFRRCSKTRSVGSRKPGESMAGGCPTRDQLSRMLVDCADSIEDGEIELHVAACEDCQRALEDLTAEKPGSTHLREGAGAAKTHASLWARLAQSPPTGALSTDGCSPGAEATVTSGASPGPHGPAPADWPSIPGYQVEGELGRGGMGVVYLARQVGANRLVALKMIRNPAQRARRTGPLCHRGRSPRPPQAPQHRPGLRGWQARRPAVPLPGICRGGQPRAGDRTVPPLSPPGGSPGRGSGPCGPCRSPKRYHPSRSQAREHPADSSRFRGPTARRASDWPRHAQDHGLRTGQTSRQRQRSHADRPDLGQPQLHGARASHRRRKSGPWPMSMRSAPSSTSFWRAGRHSGLTRRGKP